MWVLSQDKTGLLEYNRLYVEKYESKSCEKCSEYQNNYCNALKTLIEDEYLICDGKCFVGSYYIKAKGQDYSYNIGKYKTLDRAKEIMVEISNNLNHNETYSMLYIMPEN
jgi:hypothetical protein